MNSKILAPKRNIGAITIKKLQGGETTLETVFQDVRSADIDALNRYMSSELREHLKELKEKRAITPVKDRVVRSSLTKRISAIAKILNRRKSTKPRFRNISYKYSAKELQTHVEYEVENSVSESMIRNGLDSIYEIQENGDNMKKKINIKEITNEHGQPDYEVIHGDVSDNNSGALKVKDLLCLYHSNRLYLFDEPLDKKGIQDERIIVQNLVDMIQNPLISIKVSLVQNGISYLTPIEMLERRVFKIRDRSKQETAFLLNLKGDAIKAKDCKYYNKEEEKWIELKALSYNQLDYENNHVVVIAKPETLNHIENRCKKLHEEFYHFESESGEIIHGIHGLNKHEENVLKKIKREKPGFDEEEIQELFDVLKSIDGRQTIRNIEYDIKSHTEAKYILSKSSDELFYLKMALEDTPEYAKEVLSPLEYESYLEVIGYLEKQMNKVTNKKITALKNVVSGLHLRYEDEEDLGKYMSEELDEIDKVARERNFSFDRTHKNYYSQTEGVLLPNGNPQTSHKRKSNPPSMTSLRILRKRHKYSIGGLYTGVSDCKVLSKIYTGPGEPNFFKKVMMDIDKEYERVFGVKTPTPSISFKAYPWSAIFEILGLDEESKDVLLETYSEVNGYLSKNKRDYVREAIFEALEEKYPAPQFRVPSPSKPKDYSKVCNICKNEGTCFVEKIKRYNDIKSLTPYAKEELGFVEYDGDVIRGVLDEIKGYLPNKRLPAGFKEIKGITLFKDKLKKENNEEDSTPLPPFRIIGDNMVEVNVKGKMVPLYAKGDLSILELPSVSIAGTRKPSEETSKFIKDTITDLADEYVIVSGLALGCDTIAHRAALDANGLTIAVLPCGFNNIAPAENTKLAEEIVAKGGLLLSEYPPEEKAFKQRYVQRNRIIAALPETVVICEGGKGTAHTKRFAKEQGKNILVQPPLKKEQKKGARVKKDWNQYLKDFDANYECSIPKETLKKLEKIGNVQRLNQRDILGNLKRWASKEDGKVTFENYWRAKRNLSIEYNVEGVKLRYSFDSTCGRGMYIDLGSITDIRERVPLSQIFTYRMLRY